MSKRRNRDLEAVWRWLQKFQERLHRYVATSPMLRGRDAHQVVHDVFQDHLLHTWKTDEAVTHSFKYLVISAYHRLCKPLPREERICMPYHRLGLDEKVVSETSPGRLPEPPQWAIRRDLLILLWDRIRDLPPRQKQVMTLHILGLSSVEIAMVLGLSSDNVRFHRHRGLIALRKKLDPAA